MLTKAQKEETVAELTDKFKQQKVAVFTDFHGMSVTKAQELRRSLKKDVAEFKVARKTLLDLALEKAGIDFNTKGLQGEIGVAFGYNDEAAPAQTLLKFTKDIKTFRLLGGILGIRILDEQETLALAKLPQREVLLSQLVGIIQGPLRSLVTVLSGNTRNLVTVLTKIKDSKS